MTIHNTLCASVIPFRGLKGERSVFRFAFIFVQILISILPYFCQKKNMDSHPIYTQHYVSSFGELILGSFENQLCLCDWRYRKQRANIDKRLQDGLKADFVDETSDVLEATKFQLGEYFKGVQKVFQLPIVLVGTDFQKSVWNELLKIPFGETRTYLQLSKQLNNEKAIRAVASVNGANALSIIVPCHRIIGSDGNMVGYAGGLQAKKKLLQLENKDRNSQLELFMQV